MLMCIYPESQMLFHDLYYRLEWQESSHWTDTLNDVIHLENVRIRECY